MILGIGLCNIDRIAATYAKRCADKEAGSKALGTGPRSGI